MSYLDTPTLVFTGDIQADVNTVNNDVRHYKTATFKSSYQDVQDPGGALNGWWNPDGGSTFRFVDCKVQRCIGADGEAHSDRSLLGAEVSGAKDLSSGKMVDLDPQMQMTSELWGVRLMLTDTTGRVVLSGDLHVAGFRDLQMRQFPSGSEDWNPNRQPLGSVWSTTLENIETDAAPGSAIAEMLAASDSGELAVNLTIFGFYYSHADERFSMGHVLGTIGPRRKEEPLRFAATRRLHGTAHLGKPQPNQQPPPVVFDVSHFTVDAPNRRLRMNLGMTLPLAGPSGALWQPITDQDDGHVRLTIGVAEGEIPLSPTALWPPVPFTAPFESIGEIDIANPQDWLMETGGIASLPVTVEQLARLENHQLVLLLGGRLVAHETTGGCFARVDQNVMRLDPGDTLAADIYVYRFGKPLKGKRVKMRLQKRTAGAGGSGSPLDGIEIPDINVPAGKVQVANEDTTDAAGKLTIQATGSDPGNPRRYLDGQMYLFDYSVEGETLQFPSMNLDQLFVHMRDAFEVPDEPTWDDLKEVWVQFANLYPLMSKQVIDLRVPEALMARREILLFAFNRPMSDPTYMPATRDISANKMEAMKKWLERGVIGTFTEGPAPVRSRAAASPTEGAVSSGGDEDSPLARLTRLKGGVPSAMTRFEDNLTSSNNE